MKKLYTVIAVLFMAAAFFAVTVNPSLDGRAMVADRGIFPSGNYGKAPGYLPGDTVIVTNHSTGFAIEVMILSTFDASEGIAILLSPEAAEKLNIDKGKDVYVKIQKKQANPFEKVITAAANEGGKDITVDPDSNPSKIFEDSPELLQFINDSRVAAETVSPKVIEIMPEQKTELAQAVPEIETPEVIIPSSETLSAIDPVEENPVIEEIAEIENQPVEEIAEITSEPIEDVAVIEPAVEEVYKEPVVEEVYKEPSDDEIVPLYEEPVEITQQEDVPDEETVLETTEEVSVHEEEILEEIAEDESQIIEEVVETESDGIEEVAVIDPINEVPAEEVVEELAQPVVDEIVPVLEESVDIAEEDLPPAEDSPIIVDEPEVVIETAESRNIYEEIVNGLGDEIPELVPTIENPPQVAETVKAVKEEAIIIEPKPVETPVVQLEEKAGEKGIAKYSNLLKKAEALEKNKYYIQIATLREVESIDTVIASYGSKYPLNLILVDAKYQVLVGPFTDDEYAVIFERFRQKEFKDAFVKKIK